MKYRITKHLEVAGAHRLQVDGENPCSRVHGHNWKISVTCESNKLDGGMVVDFGVVKKLVHGALDHRHINDLDFLPSWLRENPTAEHIALWILETVPRCVEVTVQESDGNECTVTI